MMNTFTMPRGGLALFSGLLGALASCFAKIAFGSLSLCSDNNTNATCALEITVRLVGGLSMLACNALMLGSFLEGLDESGSVAGTALSSASNFGWSALLGYIFWVERFTRTWWIGFLLVSGGAMLLSTVKVEQEKERSKIKSD
jgi:drug/metabolite transporter (DMT)-like permease